jgi:hypothetical protein
MFFQWVDFSFVPDIIHRFKTATKEEKKFYFSSGSEKKKFTRDENMGG